MESVLQFAKAVLHVPVGVAPVPGVAPVVSQYLLVAWAGVDKKEASETKDRRISFFIKESWFGRWHFVPAEATDLVLVV